jgi:preprotein translocase subunit SecG
MGADTELKAYVVLAIMAVAMVTSVLFRRARSGGTGDGGVSSGEDSCDCGDSAGGDGD